MRTKGLLCGLLLGGMTMLASGATGIANHETNSKARYEDMQERLSKYAAAGDEAGLRRLTAQLDAQLKLEDFLIKFREAEHAGFKLWGSIVLPSIVSVVTTLITLSATLFIKGKAQ